MTVVGIDFGTSNSAVAAFIDGKNQVIPDESGNRLTASIVSFGKNDQILVGADARTQGLKNPSRTVHSIKRLIGRKIYSAEIKKSQVLLPYELVESEGQNVAVKIDEQTYSPQQIAAFIIRHVKDVAKKALKQEITQCVVTVPAYFNDSQRQTTKEACQIAGLESLRIINEPTAAALAYGFGKALNETVAVYDLGGGTFDISILKLKDKVFEVIATAGDTFLGGDDFDDRIIDIIAEDFRTKTGIDLRSIPQALPLLRINAEKTKRRLSYAERTDLYIPGIVQKDGKTVDLHFNLSREQLKERAKDLIQRTFTVCDEAMRAAGLQTSDLDAVILVGGPTKMPLIQEAVRDYFGKEPLSDLNPDEVVAIGASIQASSLVGEASDKKALLLDVTPLDLGVATVDGYVETLIDKNSPIPVQASKIFTTTSDNQDKVDIRIYQGKNRRVEESNLLGEFRLTGFPKKKAGEAAIDVSFSINTDGIVQVSALEKETGLSQNVEVRLSAAIGAEGVAESAEKTKDFQEVRLKDPMKDATKVLVYRCGSSPTNSDYVEGYSVNFNPEDLEITLLPDTKGERERQIPQREIGWICMINDFNNIPRYIRSLTEKSSDTKLERNGMSLHEFNLTDGSSIRAYSGDSKVGGIGFWVSPDFPDDKLVGKVFIYNSKLKNMAPVAPVVA
ncbi:MAG: molecular chaperone DnaK [Deltaproteobacteria bacterium CG11_big_fil_rev_8_21_14_0_20_45_16]|nr:MAG: molecular chaperone DnaK [Deltaproteobacteria bacterium CG11_big_fil_rev_8_21_14_0_20_45_16]